jgi:glycosyltransferase involved in cell wall biosynthesis
MSDSHRPLIGYLMKTYPKLSETFILNEILELERQGVSLHLFSLRRSPKDKVHPDVARVRAQVTYIPSLLPEFHIQDAFLLLKAHVQLFWKNPQRYLRAWKFHRHRPESKRLNEFLQGGYLATVLQKLGIHHVQAHFANVPTATTEIAQQFSDISYNIFAHAKDIYLTDPEVLDRRIASAKFTLTCTAFNRRYLQAISTSSTPIYLSYHGIDFDRFTPPVAKPQTDRPLILSVGRLCEKKGFPYLIQACHQLKRQGHQFQCEIVGYGELQDLLQQMITDLGLADVVSLAGKMDQDELVQVYKRTSVFVLPCQVMENGDRDGIPNVLLEAMAMEIPVVSTDISGISELIEPGVNGILVPEKDSWAIAHALETMLENPKEVRKWGKNGRDRVLRQFSLENNVAEIRMLLSGSGSSCSSTSTENTIKEVVS